MLAVIAGVIFIIGVILGWTDKAVPLDHLIAVGFLGLVFIAAHLAFRVWLPDGRRW